MPDALEIIDFCEAFGLALWISTNGVAGQELMVKSTWTNVGKKLVKLAVTR